MDVQIENLTGTLTITGGQLTANLGESAKPPKLQDKTVTLSGSQQVISADTGYDGLHEVTVPAVSLQDKTVTLSGSQQVISADNGYDGLGDVTVPAVTLQNKTVTPTGQQQEIEADSGYTGLGTVTVGAASGYELPQLMFKGYGYTGTISVSAPTGDTNKIVDDIPNIENLVLPDAAIIDFQAAYSNPKLKTISAPVATGVKASAFQNCTALESASFPAATTLQEKAFVGDTALETVDIRSYVGYDTDAFNDTEIFNGCTALETVTATALHSVNRKMFYGCTSLESITLPSLQVIMQQGFYGCTALKDLYLPGSTVVNLVNTNALNNTAIMNGQGLVHVPANLEDSYKAANNWATIDYCIIGDQPNV